jgi:hypothetical protein
MAVDMAVDTAVDTAGVTAADISTAAATMEAGISAAPISGVDAISVDRRAPARLADRALAAIALSLRTAR